jgi:hypothetical protein
VDKNNIEDDDLLGEDLVDYRAKPKHAGMDVNVITFSTDYDIIDDDEPVVSQFNLVLKRLSSPSQKNRLTI